MIDWAEKLRLVGEDPSGPRYVRVQQLIRQAATVLPPGTALPGEVECAALAGVSRETIRKALSHLVTEGYVTVRRGHGAFTSVPRVQTGLDRVQGFTDAVWSMKRTPSTRLIRIDRERADSRTSDALCLKRAEDVWAVQRVRLIDGEPAMIETAYLPADPLPDLDRQDLAGSLYSILARVYSLKPESGEESIFAVNADRSLAKLLDIPIASALLASVRISRSLSKVPIERTLRFVRPELCAYCVTLSGSAGLHVRSEAEANQPFDQASIQ